MSSSIALCLVWNFCLQSSLNMISTSELEIGILIGQKWKSASSSDISKFQLIVLENYSFEFFHQVLNWRFHTNTGLSHWRISGFFPYIGLNSSSRISIDNFSLSKMHFFFKIKCCLFNLYFHCHLDGKYLSAAAPLVQSFLSVQFLTILSSVNKYFLTWCLVNNKEC